jgi:hypothetical protein
MGVEDINDNLTNDSVNLNNVLTSFDARNDMLDKILDNEIYNQELYNGGKGSRYEGKGDDLKGSLFDIVTNTTNFDLSNVDKLEELDVSNVSLSYNKSADMYRNQKAIDYYVDEKKQKFKARNKELLQDVENRIRQKEIFTFYYKKYNAQKKILVYIILASVLTIVLTYLNKRFKFLITDTIFILAVGIIFAFLVINICIQLFEIFFRNNTNFDEYGFMFQNKSNMSNIIDKSKAYKGR